MAVLVDGYHWLNDGQQANPSPPPAIGERMFEMIDTPGLAVLITAMEQFVENQPELEEWEAEAPEVGSARTLLDAAEAERLQRLS